jgi:hypothetical protein
MAELLIKAREPWNNDISTLKMTEDEKRSFDSRTRKGDIIVVRPDGWQWGKLECLPDYVVVKTKDSYDDAKKYEEPLTEEKEVTVDKRTETTTEVIKCRKHAITALSVDGIADEVKDFEEITPVELTATITEKSIDGDTLIKNN